MQLIRLLVFLLFFVCAGAELRAASPDVALMTLKGYLGKDEIAKARQILDSAKASQLVIEINSSSGDLAQVIDLAKRIYELKTEKGLKITVYIEDNALGPAAILPFLADELYISLFVSWGDIPYGAENILSTNILRNRVISLISPSSPHEKVLRVVAAGMSDPAVKIVDDKGWRIAVSEKDNALPVISSTGETLVVNQNQIKDLGLAAGVMSLEKFEGQFKFNVQQQEELKEQQAVETTTLMPSENAIDNELRKHIKYNEKGPNTVGLITIGDHTSEINESTWLYVKNALDYYKKNKPAFLILELNTPGGEVFAAQKISDALKEMDTQYNIPVVAYINNWAISAGAMLAYSCRFIAVVKDASMGAAEPLTVEGGEMKVASEKVNSALRADFANRANFFGRNPYIAEAMVDKDVILVLRHGKIIKLDNEDQIKKTGPEPDVLIKAKGKLLTLTAEQLISDGVADILLLPSKLEPMTAKEQESGKWPANKNLLFTYPFFAKIPQATIDVFQMDWKTKFFVLLANPIVASLLFLGMLIGFYVEFSTGGFGLAGTVGVTCLFLIILSSFALEIANWLELILLLTGLIIILVELFVLPTFGLLGFIGIIFFIVGLFGMMLPGAGSVSYEFDTNTLNAAGQAFFERLAWLCGTLVLGFVIIAFLARFITPKLAGFSRFVLTGHEQEGYIAGEKPETLPQPGAKGEVLSTLRPAGKIIIDDKVYDAISYGAFIEKGMPIVVERLEGSVIVVNNA